jgi:hypothetical protein
MKTRIRRNIFMRGTRLDAFWVLTLIAFGLFGFGVIMLGLWLAFHA